MMRDWSALPDSALVSMMSGCALQHRLQCARVSSSWAAAAAVATREMCLSHCPDPFSITAHLSSSYSSIISLQIDAGPKQLLSKVPALPNLQELQILQTRVQLGPGFSAPGILHGVTALTHLLLHEVTLIAGLKAVSVLTSLRSLSLVDCMQPTFGLLQAIPTMQDCSSMASTDAEVTGPVPIPGSIFSELVQLTYLELRGGLTDSTLQHISRLTNLDSLAVDFEGSPTSPAAIRGLDRLQGLSFLALTDADIELSPDTVPGLSRLAGLEALWLYNCRSIDPLLLIPLTKLQHLDLDSTPAAGGSKGAAVLLAVLPRLQYLTHLDLCDCLITAAAPAAAYSALTASNKLAYLDISGAEPPADAWRHMLPAKRPLTALQRLHLAGVYEASTEGLSVEQLQHLVQACPRLENLQCWLQPSVSPEALLELTALTGLALQGVTEEVADSVLLQLTALQDLHIVPDSSIDDAGMLRFTALTQLTQLGVHHDACSPEFCEQYSALAVKDGEDFVLVFNTENYPAGTPRDVWLQLLRCCAKSPKCKPLLPECLQLLALRLAVADQELQQLKQQMQRHQSSGSRSMVEVQLQVADLGQQACTVQVVVQDLKNAIAVVAGALEGSGESAV